MSVTAFADSPRERARRMLTGPGIEVDPGFGYYQGRSAASIAAEVKVNGYKHVHYVVTKDAAIRRDLIDAFHAEGLPVWYTTFGNVSYDTADLPPGWERWRMKLRASEGLDYVRLCMTDPGYRDWKARRVAYVMGHFPFDGVEVVEPFWPDAGGPAKDVYGCLNEACLKEFASRHPDVDTTLDFTDPDSTSYYKKKPEVYAKWVDFRVRSSAEYLAAVFAAARKAAPGKPCLGWSLAQLGEDTVRSVREDQGCDAVTAFGIAKPDAWCFQTNWMDWIRADLPPDYVRGYKGFIEPFLKAFPGVPTAVQLDIGSLKDNRQSRSWVLQADKESQKLGAVGTISYEYFISRAMYDEPPRLMEVRSRPGGVALVFQKRIDAGKASVPGNYSVTDANGRQLKVAAARADGNLALLGVRGLKPGQRYKVVAREVQDTPALWLFKGYPGHTVRNVTRAFTWRPPAKAITR
jgi:hypothetical protein